jgi:hypothetical protein
MMPDTTETTAPAAPPPVPADPATPATTPVLTDAQKQQLVNASGPIWKKVLWWVLGILGVIGGAIGILYVLKGKTPTTAVKESVASTKAEIAKSDLEAKIKVAEAAKMEQQVIDKLKEIKEIPDEKKRLDELNKLL